MREYKASLIPTPKFLRKALLRAVIALKSRLHISIISIRRIIEVNARYLKPQLCLGSYQFVIVADHRRVIARG